MMCPRRKPDCRNILRDGLRILFGLLPVATSCAAAEFKAALDRSTIGLGETVTLNLVAENGTIRGTLPRLPAITNVDMSAPNPSTQVTSMNGETKVLFTVSYYLRPRQQGNYEIPAVEVDVGDRRLASQPVSLRVIEPVATTGEASAGSLAYLRLILPRTEVFVGETFPVEMQIYASALQNAPRPQMNADGFSLGRMAQAPSATTYLNNQQYQVFVLRWSAAAAKSGDLPMGPAECELDLQVPSGRLGFFQNYEVRPVRLRTPTQIVKSIPLPAEGRPPTFNGAVGEFSLTFDASPTNLVAGDPITVKSTISGIGAIDSLVLPAQPQWEAFKSYPPSSTTELTDETGTAGSKTRRFR